MANKAKSLLPTSRKHRPTPGPQEKRLRGFHMVPNWVRNELIAFIGEFIGTFMFLFLAFVGTSVANAATLGQDTGTDNAGLTQVPNTSSLLYIAFAFGFSLVVNVWAFFRVSGGLFNPAVTLGLYLIGAVNGRRSINVFIAQIVASIAAAGVVSGILPGQFAVATTLGGNTSVGAGFALEMFLTAELVFVIFMLAAEKHKSTYLAPLCIGLTLFVCELAGVFYTGGSLNPARSFGPAVVTGIFPGHHWIYWVGPALGSLIATGVYKFLKYAEYETANPGQDFDDHEADLFEPDPNAITGDEVARPNVAAETTEQILEQVTSGNDSTGVRSGSSGSKGGAGRPSHSQGSWAAGANHHSMGGQTLYDKEGAIQHHGPGTLNGRTGSQADTYLPDGITPLTAPPRTSNSIQ